MDRLSILRGTGFCEAQAPCVMLFIVNV